ncbi:MAG: helix-turn-helix domain-containing protein [Magnetospirillum sp. WYHS-4]
MLAVTSRQFVHRLLSVVGSALAALGSTRGCAPAPEPGNGDLLALEEVAARIGVDVPGIRRAIAKGDLPAVWTGKEQRVERSALERTLAIVAANYGSPP